MFSKEWHYMNFLMRKKLKKEIQLQPYQNQADKPNLNSDSIRSSFFPTPKK